MQLVHDSSTLDQSPIAELYQRHWLIILVSIRQLVPSREDAEDLLLEVFLAALESDILSTLGEKQQLAWLRRVARNKCVDYFRRTTRQRAVPLEEAAETLCEGKDNDPELTTLCHEEQSLLRNRLASLTEVQQQVLSLRFGDGLRCEEIARVMNRTEGAIRTLLSRTLNLLRSIYTQAREEPYHDGSR